MSKYPDSVSLREFAEQHGTNINNIHAQKSNGRIPKDAFVIENGRAKGIRPQYFYKRWEFHEIMNQNNQNLYFLLTAYFSVRVISRMIERVSGGEFKTIKQYLNNGLFHRRQNVITTVAKAGEWTVYKYFRKLSKRMEAEGFYIDNEIDVIMSDDADVLTKEGNTKKLGQPKIREVQESGNPMLDDLIEQVRLEKEK